MILQHNLPRITSGRNMTKNKVKLSKNLEKLSSGYRINRAGDDAAGLAISEGMRCQIRGIEDASVMTISQANDSIELFNQAIDYLDSERGRMGAYENRLEHTYNSQAVSYENLTQAESRIRDTDMAEETVEYTKNNILLQASQSMLAHANMLPQHVMQLLG